LQIRIEFTPEKINGNPCSYGLSSHQKKLMETRADTDRVHTRKNEWKPLQIRIEFTGQKNEWNRKNTHIALAKAENV
jgi:hypothetical protein